MLPLRVLLFAVVVALLAAPPVYAVLRPLTPEELQREADIIVIGKVQSYRTEARVTAAGEELTRVFLEVLVVSIEKGKPEARVGQILQVSCERVTRPSLYPLPGDLGQRQIPAVGSRARFFVRNEYAIAPNGVEVIEGGSELDLPMKSKWTALLELPFVLLPVVALALLALMTAALIRRRAKRRGVG
jgi:hypothetical protein